MILQVIKGERFSEVLPLWKGLVAVIIGGGPSLSVEQVETVRRSLTAENIRVIAVNDAYLLAPWADVHYAADAHWHRWHTAGIDKPALSLSREEVAKRWAEFRGQKCTIQSSGGTVEDMGVHMMRNRDFPGHGEGLSMDSRYLVTGRNSGFQALNLAVLAGARRVLLLGFDGQPGQDGRDHFHGGHPRPTPREAYPLYRSAMVAASAALSDAGVEVLNCTPGSAITCFPSVELSEALNG